MRDGSSFIAGAKMIFYDLFRNHPKLRSVPASHVLFQQGDPGDFMYVLISGTAEIRVGDVVVEHAERGTIVGEMAVIDKSPRSATVVASTDCSFAVIDERRFQFLVDETPRFAIEVMRVMARRLRQSDQGLAISAG